MSPPAKRRFKGGLWSCAEAARLVLLSVRAQLLYAAVTLDNRWQRTDSWCEPSSKRPVICAAVCYAQLE
jgi:hypothetical protein